MHNLDGVLIALIFWGFIAVVAIGPMVLRYREKKELHKTVQSIVANGGTPSDELMKTLQAPTSYRDNSLNNGEQMLAAGIILTCIGIGVIVFGGVLGYVLWFNDINDGKAGLIAGPIVSGGGFIVLMIGTALRMIGKQAVAARQARQDV